MEEKNDMEYDIVDSMQCSLPYAKQDDDGTFCTSQDFFMSQEIETTKKQSQEDAVVKSDKSTNEEELENTDFESSEEITNKKRILKKKPIKVFQGRQKRSAAGNISEQKTKNVTKKQVNKKSTTSISQDEEKCHETKKQVNKKSTTSISQDEEKCHETKNQSSNIKRIEDCKNMKFNLSEDEQKIFDFFYNINRPVSSSELVLNFKKQISLTSLTNICSKLEEKKLIIIKLYTKTKVYMIHPDVFDGNESEENKNKLKVLKDENDKLKNEFSTLTQEYKNLKNMDTEEEINDKIEKYKSDLHFLQLKVKARDDGELVSKKEIENFDEKVKKYTKIKKSREKLLNEILGMLSENMNVKKNELIEELELEM